MNEAQVPAPSPEAAPPEAPPAVAAPRRRRPVLSVILRLLTVGLALALAGVAVVVGIFVYYGRDLPSFEALADYRPPEVTRVVDRQGAPVAEYYRERRTVVPRERIPTLLKQAVVAAEDGSFYSHKGLDYVGIARAVLKDLSHLRMAQGASTITQQVVKNMVLSPERSLARKVKEAILARRLEQNLSKEDILFLYLNHIYFGHNRYGVEEAAQFFFGKPVDRLSLGETAVLAGLPQSPMRLSPLNHPDKAKSRQTYVLRQMVQNGFITQAQADQEIARPLTIAPRPPEPVGGYYVEEVRRLLVDRYGEDRVQGGGLRVQIAMDRSLQALADESLQRGLEELDHRFGLRPAQVTLPPALQQAARAAWLASRKPDAAPKAWSFARLAEAPKTAEELLEKAEDRSLVVGAELVVPVAPVSAWKGDAAAVELGRGEAMLPFEQLKWARPWGPGKWTAPPKKAADVLAPGQLVRVRVVEVPPSEKTPVLVALAPVPQVQGALVAVDPETRHVVALSGGYDFATSAFNRATQARRQPGSSFKPFLYAAAIASGRFTAASIVNDAPDLFRDPWTGKEWKPRNFEDDQFEGPMSLRRALAKSKNTVAVRLIDAVGAQALIDVARKAGINSPLPESLTLALGTGEVSPLELANGYATLAALGRRADPILIVKVTDRDGKVLEEHHAVPEETLPPAVAFVVTSMMRSVIEYDYGTGHSVAELKRPMAGKTGTASDGRDAWFAAFTPDLSVAVWTGFDDHSSMGQNMTGGRAALPIWKQFMRGALESRPRRDFPMPPGVEVVAIDPASGLRSPEGAPGREEYFVEGTAPKDFAQAPGQADPRDLFLLDGGDQRP